MQECNVERASHHVDNLLMMIFHGNLKSVAFTWIIPKHDYVSFVYNKIMKDLMITSPST